MTDTELEAIIVEYARTHLSPTEIEQEDISKRYEQLRDFLEGRTFQNGSYARYTSTTPVNDLDVIYVLPEAVFESARARTATLDPNRLDIHQIVETLARELREFYGTSATVKAQPHSVGIYFGEKNEFSIDVVPSVPADGGMYWVPEVAHLSVGRRRARYESLVKLEAARGGMSSPPAPNWIKSDPKGYIAQATAVDDHSGGRFRKAAKVMKKWRWHCKVADDRFSLKSFHLELAVTALFQRGTISCVQGVQLATDGLADLLSRPRFPDRADGARFVDAYVQGLSTAERDIVLAQAEVARRRWGAVKEAKSKGEVLAALERFLGSAEATPARLTSVKVIPTVWGLTPAGGREAGEEFLGDRRIPIACTGEVRINAKVLQRGFSRPFLLRGTRNPLKKGADLKFYIQSCSVPEPFEVKWKVKNTGREAAEKGQLRGYIHDDDGSRTRPETTSYFGNHYVHCYVIKGDTCVAMDHIDVPIGRGFA